MKPTRTSSEVSETEANDQNEEEDESSQPKKEVSFVQEGPTFEDLARELTKYTRLSKRIQYESRRTIKLGLFEIHCDDLIRALAKRVEGIVDRLLDRILEDHRTTNRA